MVQESLKFWTIKKPHQNKPMGPKKESNMEKERFKLHLHY
jgi:hypothetical protein